jgi:hypothetical protein
VGTFELGDGGPQVYERVERPRPVTLPQWRSRRNAMWLEALEFGLQIDTGWGSAPITTADLANLWGVSSQCVLNGLQSARSDRAAIRAFNQALA